MGVEAGSQGQAGGMSTGPEGALVVRDKELDQQHQEAVRGLLEQATHAKAELRSVIDRWKSTFSRSPQNQISSEFDPGTIFRAKARLSAKDPTSSTGFVQGVWDDAIATAIGHKGEVPTREAVDKLQSHVSFLRSMNSVVTDVFDTLLAHGMSAEDVENDFPHRDDWSITHSPTKNMAIRKFLAKASIIFISPDLVEKPTTIKTSPLGTTITIAVPPRVEKYAELADGLKDAAYKAIVDAFWQQQRVAFIEDLPSTTRAYVRFLCNSENKISAKCMPGTAIADATAIEISGPLGFETPPEPISGKLLARLADVPGVDVVTSPGATFGLGDKRNIVNLSISPNTAKLFLDNFKAIEEKDAAARPLAITDQR